MYSDGDRARFWSKVDQSGGSDACWNWTAALDGKGYGAFQLHGVKRAHRLAWEMTHDSIDGGLCVCHVCDNRACCNPSHMFLGTKGDNIRDMFEKGRNNTKRGEEKPQARMTQALAMEIRRRHILEGTSQSQLAREYGFHSSHICRIVHGKRWAHLACAERGDVPGSAAAAAHTIATPDLYVYARAGGDVCG
jgi:hypothetical protein